MTLWSEQEDKPVKARGLKALGRFILRCANGILRILVRG